LAVPAAAWLFRVPLLTAAGNFLVQNQAPQKADAIVVLGGDDGGLRITKAAQLAQAGYAPFVLVSGPATLIGHESDTTIEYAKSKGYPGWLFHPFPHTVNSTRSETALIGKYLRSQGIHKILLVTSNYHTHRAAYLMRKQNPWLQVVIVAAPDYAFTPNGWWMSRDGQKTFLFEWMKTIATWSGN
jgi:uncharacterized SAM-binding protein YcdF (DUF218 family)